MTKLEHKTHEWNGKRYIGCVGHCCDLSFLTVKEHLAQNADEVWQKINK